jgi:predicted proteasome-type protease
MCPAYPLIPPCVLTYRWGHLCNMTLYRTDSLEIRHRAQFQAGDPYLIKMRKHWEIALKEASASMPDISWNQETSMNEF